MRKAAFDLRSAVGAIAVWLALAPAVSAQTFPQYTADGGGSSSRAPCTTVAAGGVNSTVPAVYQEDCTHASGLSSASQGVVAAAAHATALGNSGDVIQSAGGTFSDQIVFTSTDSTATSAIVQLNVDLVTRLRAGVTTSVGSVAGFVALSGFGSGGSAGWQVSLTSDPTLDVSENNFTRINDTGGFTAVDTYEQHVTLRSPGMFVYLNIPITLTLHLGANASVRNSGAMDAGATLALPTGIDIFTVPSGVTVNGPASFIVNNRFSPPTPDVSVAPTSYDFGNVNVGSSATTLVTITNVGGLDLTLSGIGLANGSSSAITITQKPTLPAVIAPNGTVDVQLTYAPTALAIDQAVLDLTSNDPDQPVIQVGMSGAGVSGGIPPLQQIADILTLFDASVADNTLVGSGAGRSAQGRLQALRNMIKAAGELIQEGFFAAACDQLRDAQQRMDGVPKPPEFAQGSAAATLLDMITTLRSALGCQ